MNKLTLLVLFSFITIIAVGCSSNQIQMKHEKQSFFTWEDEKGRLSGIASDESEEILNALKLTIPHGCADIFVRGITYTNYKDMGYSDSTISYYKIEFDGVEDYEAFAEVNSDLTADYGIYFDDVALNNYKLADNSIFFH